MILGAAGAGWLAVYLLAAPATSGGRAAESRLNVRIRGPQAENIEAALRRAVARLQMPQCAAVLDDFRDSRGLTLREGLEADGFTVAEHASRIFFYDGSNDDTCHRRAPLAYTTPFSRVVLVCVKRFVALSLLRPEWAEATLIHEILHTLGLGENPPTSPAITGRVMARCCGTAPPAGSSALTAPGATPSPAGKGVRSSEPDDRARTDEAPLRNACWVEGGN